MSRRNQREEKIVLNDDVNPERHSPFYKLSFADFIKVWNKVTKTGERYAENAYVDRNWFDVVELTDNPDH